ISLLAGQKITISDIINPTITYSIAAPENEAINLGDIFAKGGNINVRAANIRNQGKLSADSVSKDKSGNIVLSAKEGEAEIGGVISAQNQQAKGGKLMITGDKVTLKTGAVIDLSGKEGGETYLGGDERGEGKNGIQLAKKTSLEKGSTINVSGKEKGGRAIVWGDIALIDGNINAQGSDIAKTGGFVETSGHYLSIDSNAIVKTKEWLLDPDNVTIEAPSLSRADTDISSEFPIGDGTENSPKKNADKTILTNETISNFLQNAKVMNITAKRKLTVNSSISIGSRSHLILHSEGQGDGGVQIDGDITSEGGNLTINSGGWVDVHKNITLGTGFLNITAGGSVAFEKGGNNARNATDAQITAQGTITVNKDDKQFRFNNVSINGTGEGLKFIANQNNFTHKFDGEINISGIVTINQTTKKDAKYWHASKDSYWNVSSLTLNDDAKFTFIKFVDSGSNSQDLRSARRRFAGVHFNGTGGKTNFNIGANAKALFKLKPNAATDPKKELPITFNANITATGSSDSSVMFDIHANLTSRAASINMDSINITGGLDFSITSHNRNSNAFEIKKDLTINATNSKFSLKQTKDLFENQYTGDAINSTRNLTILGGNVTLGGENSSSNITGNITIAAEANVTLQAYADNSIKGHKKKTLTLGNVSTSGNLSLTGSKVEVKGDLAVLNGATFKGETNDSLNITGTFTNNGTADINIKRGVVNIQGDITNKGGLNITTNAQKNQKTIINGNITNKKGNLNITNNGNDTEIQIGGNISQKEGNLTISSDKVNITKQITIKAGVDEKDSSSSTASDANLTIKTKELKLVEDLNISGFNKAEITAKDGSDLTIGNTNSADGTNAKKVTFNQVKDSKISANDHNVTLNSKVETSGNTDNTGDGSGNNAGLTIAAKNVEVKNNITSNKTVNITASEKLTTKADATINATTGNVEVTAKTGDIKGEVKSTSGNVNITANGDTLNVSNVSGNAVTITADKGKLTTQESSTISGTESVTTSSQSGDIGGAISGNTVSVKATNDLITKANSKIEAKTGEANVTSATGIIGGTISGNTVNVTANTGSLTIKGGAKVDATNGAATLTAESGKLTTQAGSTITSNNGQTTLTAKDGSIAGSIDAANVTLNTTGTLTTVVGSSINANEGTLVINAQDATLNGDASGDRTEVN
ncbi:beta strand repeat-containing protein, partial [Haemophilus influenzae]|uniref:beta strand repeat-containing protein n=1 Tax=Haemophilus influenzae TaxID=727 RepID=UPI000CFF9FC3